MMTVKKKVRAGKKSDLLRQRCLAKLIAENGGKVPIGRLMIMAGYSKQYSKNPQRMKKTRSWQELMEDNLPDDLLTKKHNELLRATSLDHYIFPGAVSDKEIKEVIDKVPGCRLVKVQRNPKWARAYFVVPDNRSRKEAIDMAYKLKNKYPKGQVEDHEVIVHIRKDD